jgi:hypothetical protein
MVHRTKKARRFRITVCPQDIFEVQPSRSPEINPLDFLCEGAPRDPSLFSSN